MSSSSVSSSSSGSGLGAVPKRTRPPPSEKLTLPFSLTHHPSGTPSVAELAIAAPDHDGPAPWYTVNSG